MRKRPSMKACVQVYLTKEPVERHKEAMRFAADMMTDDRDSVSVSVFEGEAALIAEFTMPKAREMDVVEKIGRAFAMDMHDYDTQKVSFPMQVRVSGRNPESK